MDTSERAFLESLETPIKLILGGLREIDRLRVERLDPPQPISVPTSPAPVPVPPAPSAIATGIGALHESGFKFGAASLRELNGVKAILVRVAQLALQRSTQDFCIYDGLRTYKEQMENVRRGTSQTMDSKHLKGLAVDAVPWIGGKPTWDWEGCYKVALAFDQAATELGVASKITWGGAWDRTLADFGGSAAAMRQAVEDYKARHAGKDFIDGPHFQWNE